MSVSSRTHVADSSWIHLFLIKILCYMYVGVQVGLTMEPCRLPMYMSVGKFKNWQFKLRDRKYLYFFYFSQDRLDLRHVADECFLKIDSPSPPSQRWSLDVLSCNSSVPWYKDSPNQQSRFGPHAIQTLIALCFVLCFAHCFVEESEVRRKVVFGREWSKCKLGKLLKEAMKLPEEAGQPCAIVHAMFIAAAVANVDTCTCCTVGLRLQWLRKKREKFQYKLWRESWVPYSWCTTPRLNLVSLGWHVWGNFSLSWTVFPSFRFPHSARYKIILMQGVILRFPWA